MLKKMTLLAAFVALGATSFVSVSAQPVLAGENIRSVRPVDRHVDRHQDRRIAKHGAYHQRRVWHRTRFRHHPRARFFGRLRNGHIVCYRTIRRPHLRRDVRHGHSYYHSHSRRLSVRAVRRLIRSGRGHAMSCFAR
jgi:hypothetical protein